MEALLDNESDGLTRKAIELAKNGDLQALRLCLERILPPRKDRPVNDFMLLGIGYTPCVVNVFVPMFGRFADSPQYVVQNVLFAVVVD